MNRWIMFSLVILTLLVTAGVASAERGDIGGPPLRTTTVSGPSLK